MHKKDKVNGHVVHKLPKCENLYYTVEPENSRICVHMLKYDEGTGEPYYNYYGYMNIGAKQLGRHGYLDEQINYLVLKYSDITPIRNYLEKEKIINEDLKALNNTVFKEEKKMTEYYVIDVEMTFEDLKTTARTALQIRQNGNYFEIPFDAPDVTWSQLEGLERCLRDYSKETKKGFRVCLERSEICDNSVLEIWRSPCYDISDDENREELCKMLTYAVERKEYPYPPTDRNLGKLREVAFYLRECNKYEIYSKWYPAGIEGFIKIKAHIYRPFLPPNDYIMDPTDVVSLTFNNGWLTHYELADGTYHRLELSHYPIALYDIARHKEPFQSLTEVETLLREIHAKRETWKNASYLTFEHTTDREKI